MKKTTILLTIIFITTISLYSNVDELNTQKDQILDALNKTIQYAIYWIPVLDVADTIDVFEIDEIQGFEKIKDNNYKIIIADSLSEKFYELNNSSGRKPLFFSLSFIDEKEASTRKTYFPWRFVFGNTEIGYNPDFKFPETRAIVESDVALAIFAAIEAVKKKYGYSFKGEYFTDKEEKLEKLYIGNIVVQEQGNIYRIYQKNLDSYPWDTGENYRTIRFECVVEKNTYRVLKVH